MKVQFELLKMPPRKKKRRNLRTPSPTVSTDDEADGHGNKNVPVVGITAIANETTSEPFIECSKKVVQDSSDPVNQNRSVDQDKQKNSSSCHGESMAMAVKKSRRKRKYDSSKNKPGSDKGKKVKSYRASWTVREKPLLEKEINNKLTIVKDNYSNMLTADCVQSKSVKSLSNTEAGKIQSKLVEPSTVSKAVADKSHSKSVEPSTVSKAVADKSHSKSVEPSTSSNETYVENKELLNTVKETLEQTARILTISDRVPLKFLSSVLGLNVAGNVKSQTTGTPLSGSSTCDSQSLPGQLARGVIELARILAQNNTSSLVPTNPQFNSVTSALPMPDKSILKLNHLTCPTEFTALENCTNPALMKDISTSDNSCVISHTNVTKRESVIIDLTSDADKGENLSACESTLQNTHHLDKDQKVNIVTPRDHDYHIPFVAGEETVISENCCEDDCFDTLEKTRVKLEPATADLFRQDSDGDTCLHIALANNLPISRLVIPMMSAETLDVQNNFGQTPLHIATYLKQSLMVRTLVDFGSSLAFMDKYGDTPLHVACAGASKEIVNLISVTGSGKKPDGFVDALKTTNYEGYAAIHIASKDALQTKMYGILKILLDRGADVDIRDSKSGKTCLYIALEKKDYPLAKLLMKWKAAVNISTFSGYSPMHIVCEHGNIDMVKMLLKYGASLHVKNIESESPKDVASTEEIKKFLDKEMKKARRQRQMVKQKKKGTSACC